jgi:hypothetical protein
MKLEEAKELLALLEKVRPDVDIRICVTEKGCFLDHPLLQELRDKRFFVVLEGSPWSDLELVIPEKR